MPDDTSPNASVDALPTAPVAKSGEYVVVARRYRPESFEELVGQQQVSQALTNAIQTNRVGHAYLFAGARGVGKTTTARILAKCLNCQEGPTPTPCGKCDCCESIRAGEDVDVLEIDGASNNGIDEIRRLRSNASVKPSRSRFKIYIIDEVHMLSKSAFNGLLKTLEEPPEHVKFVFCTTEPEKIPITVRSRCQMFELAPVAQDSIFGRLQLIAEKEGIEAEPAALQLLARRAAGSMRDSQSLLEQLLSFCGEKVTEQDVHTMLGTAQSGRLSSIVERFTERDTAGALTEIDAAILEGVDVGQLAEQLLGYLRDMMTAVVGCSPDLLQYAAPAEHAQLAESGKQIGLETLLAAVQILDQSITRMRQSTQVRTLVEIAIVRICSLEDLSDLSALITQVRQGGPGPGQAPAGQQRRASATQKKTVELAEKPQRPRENLPSGGAQVDAPPASSSAPASPSSSSPQPEFPWTRDFAARKWKEAMGEIGGMTCDIATDYETLAIPAPNVLAVTLKADYNKEWCERPEVKLKIEQTLAKVVGRSIRIDFSVRPQAARAKQPRQASSQNRVQRMREIEQHPMIQEAASLFGTEVEKIIEKPKDGH